MFKYFFYNLKVLIPSDETGWTPGNPFISELSHSLSVQGCCVSSGKWWLSKEGSQFDIINLHWPEHTRPEKVPVEVATQTFATSLERLKKHAVVVATVHNELPHRDRSASQRRLYERVYHLVDAFIHMGKASVEILDRDFGSQVSDKPHRIIPHGNYQVFGERVPRKQARSNLGLPDRPTALVIGAIRNSQEWDLVNRQIRAVKRFGGQVIFAGKLPIRQRAKNRVLWLLSRAVDEVKVQFSLYSMKVRSSVHLIQSPVPATAMADLVSASDVLLIPRVDSLNSGNVPLGFSYGAVVCGPDCGNIGEILRQTGNVVFPQEFNWGDVQRSVGQAFRLARDGVGESNFEYATNQLSWDKVGNQYVEFFQSLVSQKVGHISSTSRDSAGEYG